ncbi:hypothetical protein FLAG1_09296 [Fusarium langsethiae]|uniref:Uncharacterized protein n=1 Tax=Fusarium langsethiae TaxID=179993 RepID=A0A0M9EQL9_FUSLA|nr:hypothetical protein FLAG1_09296 [Fusarium langsethiae]GKU07494.1 unnamed protein product [Fusarium langsethiae]
MLLLSATFCLVVTLFPYLVHCDAEFIRPPQIDTSREHDWDAGNNIQYSVGNEIQISWKSSVEATELYLVQLGEEIEWMLLDASRTEWEAEYNAGGLSKNQEDSIYAFALWEDAGGVLAQSLFFNVSAPEPKTTETSTSDQSTTTAPNELSTTSTTTSSIAESITQSNPSSSETTTTTGEDKDTTSTSNLSQGETAGAAVGGIVGGLSIFAGIGWLLWKRLSKDKSDSSMSQDQQQQTQVSEPKAELTGDHAQHDSGYARSPPGVHEAP